MRVMRQPARTAADLCHVRVSEVFSERRCTLEIRRVVITLNQPDSTSLYLRAPLLQITKREVTEDEQHVLLPKTTVNRIHDAVLPELQGREVFPARSDQDVFVIYVKIASEPLHWP